MVKLTAVVLFSTGVAIGLAPWLAPWLAFLVVLVLRLQEAIFKTCQSCLGERLLQEEQLLVNGTGPQDQAFQLHSAGLAQRKAMAGLLAEYAASARRPTVVFPYVALLLLDLVLMLLV